MKNKLRRFTQEEFELLHTALRTLEMVNTIEIKNPIEPSEGMHPAIAKLFDAKIFTDYKTAQKQQAEMLRLKLQELYHHDIDWLGDDAPKWCLACHHRHEPHCPGCMGCLPEELPE